MLGICFTLSIHIPRLRHMVSVPLPSVVNVQSFCMAIPLSTRKLSQSTVFYNQHKKTTYLLQQKQGSSHFIWFHLLDAVTGHPYNGARSDKVSVSYSADVVDFRKAVKAEYSNTLSCADSGALLVYRNKAAFDKRNAAGGQEEPLEEDSVVTGLGTSKKEALIIAVQKTFQYKEGTPTVIDFPPFDPRKMADQPVQFPFFIPNGESYLPLLERESVLRDINDISLEVHQKYSPIVISTSKGMGKTFLLKMLALQKVPSDLRNPRIQNAASCGRIISFDFARESTAIQSVSDVEPFFTRLMIYFLCMIFDGTQVDGINFQKFESFSEVATFRGNQPLFNEWKTKWLRAKAENMITEYMRLTNLAFKIEPGTRRYSAPPVFLLDEIQNLCVPTNILASLDSVSPKMHTRLSLLLTELANKYYPICICTGTNSGDILSITETSSIIPSVFSLTPLSKDYLVYWREMTKHFITHSDDAAFIETWMEQDAELINALVYASHKIPRLLFIAHQVWFTERASGRRDRLFYLQTFEAKANRYYQEWQKVMKQYTVDELAHIMLSCGVHSEVDDTSCDIPGTTLQWRNLIQKSIIFHYSNNCYVVPFTLLWAQSRTSRKLLTLKSRVEQRCEELVSNLHINDLFVSFDDLSKHDLYHVGICYETLFASSLAVKYYLKRLSNNTAGTILLFSDIYDFISETPQSISLLEDREIDFSEGIVYSNDSKKELSIAEEERLRFAVNHNKQFRSAHHDVILWAKGGFIAVSAKASFSDDFGSLKSQQLISKHSTKKVSQLIWLYLGSNEAKERKYPDVAFLDGSGCCNGLSIDLFRLVKTLKLQNNRPEK